MKICGMHWERLKTAITERGMIHLVAKNGQVALQRTTAQIQGDNTNESYDPLLNAYFTILHNALIHFADLMMEDDPPCPLCYMDDHKNTCTNPKCLKLGGDDWIRFAADGQFEEAIQRGLLSKPS